MGVLCVVGGNGTCAIVMHDMGIMHSHYPLSNTNHRKSHNTSNQFTALQ